MARYMESSELVWLMSRLALRNTFSDLEREVRGRRGVRIGPTVVLSVEP